jgi:hypothetical protein
VVRRWPTGSYPFDLYWQDTYKFKDNLTINGIHISLVDLSNPPAATNFIQESARC